MGGGGAEKVAVKLSSLFSNKGYKCYYYYWDDVKEHRFSLDKNVNIIRSNSRSIFLRIGQLRRLIINENIESVISFTDVPNIISWFASMFIRSRITFVPTVHSNVKVRDENINHTLGFFLARFLHKISCKSADKVVAVSNGARRAILNYYNLPSSKVCTIYNPVLSTVPNLIERTTIGKQVKLIAVGRLTEAKNYSQMLYAVKQLHDSQVDNFILDIYGEGELRGNIESLIKKLKLEDIVTLKGFSSNLKNLFATYDIFLMSSKWEGFGNVLVEALSSGLRIVSTNYPSGASEILDNGRYGYLVDVGNAYEFCNAINIAMNQNDIDENIYHHLGQFSTQEIFKKYASII